MSNSGCIDGISNQLGVKQVIHGKMAVRVKASDNQEIITIGPNGEDYVSEYGPVHKRGCTRMLFELHHCAVYSIPLSEGAYYVEVQASILDGESGVWMSPTLIVFKPSPAKALQPIKGEYPEGGVINWLSPLHGRDYARLFDGYPERSVMNRVYLKVEAPER